MSAAETDVQQAFPPPPPYYQDFAAFADASQDSSLPEPPPPIKGEYQLFGELHTTEDGIPPLTVRPLFSVDAPGSVDFRTELRKLNKELLFCFLDLINTLVERPSAYARSVENVGLVARNMHYLLNALRGHQARATLEETLRQEISDGKQAVEDLRSAAQRAQQLLERSEAVAQHAGISDKAEGQPELQTAADDMCYEA
ncbi:g11249 [Coccomyxa viridis]|uniref:Mediator of RNA polymerase II transcription subunit 7 n=1 Tax=Coccomyxa viridis TaxID=1274662 RepID=A0ABP1GBX0_9CHLO